MPRGNLCFAQAKALENMYGDKWMQNDGFHGNKASKEEKKKSKKESEEKTKIQNVKKTKN